MNRFPTAVLFGFGLVALTLTANAQGRYPSRNDPYYQNSPNRGDYRNGNQNSLIGRVLADLNRAASHTRLDGHEANHFNSAIQRLREFEERSFQGKFDRGRLDKAIDSMEHLASADRVSGRDRDVLYRDMQALRQFRAQGAYSYGGYGDGRYDQNRGYYPGR